MAYARPLLRRGDDLTWKTGWGRADSQWRRQRKSGGGAEAQVFVKEWQAVGFPLTLRNEGGMKWKAGYPMEHI